MNDEKKFGLAESIILILICAFSDFAEFIISSLAIIPWLIPLSVFGSWFVGVFVFGIVWVWLIMRGERGGWYLAGNIIELVPILNILPIRTASIVLTIALANSPKLKKIATSASGKSSSDSKNEPDSKTESESK